MKYSLPAGRQFSALRLYRWEFFLSARNGGGIGASNDTETFHTEAREFRDDEKFTLTGPAGDGTFTIQTLTGNVVTAVGGGGHRLSHTLSQAEIACSICSRLGTSARRK